MSDDDEEKNSFFSGRGSPAFMSLKEPALRALKERYSESFALTYGHGVVHLFLVKLGLWSLVTTFSKKDAGASLKEVDLALALSIIEDALSGKNIPMRERLDSCVASSLERIKKKAEEFL